MGNRTKYYASIIVIIISFAFAIKGLGNIQKYQGPDGITGVGFLFGGIVLGLIAAFYRKIYKDRDNEFPDMDKVGVETLAALGNSKNKKRRSGR